MSTVAATAFTERLDEAVRINQSLLCVGLDPDIEQMPKRFRNFNSTAGALRQFLGNIIEATAEIACCFKPNIGFFLALGSDGWNVLLELRSMIPEHLPLLLDAKFGDIGPTAEKCAKAAFMEVKADAVTVSPYVGGDALEPFFAYADRTTFVLCKTSNPGSGEIQDIPTQYESTVSLIVAKRLAEWGAKHNNAGAVVGATYPEQMAAIRNIVGDIPILVPGVGAQGGDIESSLRTGLNKQQGGLLFNASRSILYASADDNYADAARLEAQRLRESINKVRWQVG